MSLSTPFEVLTALPARVGVSIGNYEGASGPVNMIRDVLFSIESSPAELDLPSGAFWIWPIKRGQLQFTGFVAPGSAPQAIQNGSTGPAFTSIAISWTGPSGPTGATVQGIMSGLSLQTQRIGENMPILQETTIWDVFQETDPAYTIP